MPEVPTPEPAAAGVELGAGLVVDEPAEVKAERGRWWRDGRVPRGGAGSAPARAQRPAGYHTSRIGRRGRAGGDEPLRKLGRLISGAVPDGQARTDAGWWQRGWRCYPLGEKPPHAWWFLPRILRTLAIWAAAGAACLVGWAWWRWPEATELVAIMAVTAAGMGAGFWAMSSLLLWPHRRERVTPLARSLAPRIGLPARTPPRRFVHIPRDFLAPGAVSTLVLPANWTSEGNEKEMILGIWRAKLPVNQISATCYTTGRDHRIEVRNERKALPAKVPYSAGVRALIDRATPSRPMMAVSWRGRALGPDFDSETPHVMVNAESGGGKTSLQRLWGAQFYRHGARLVIVDPKRFSHAWAFHLPGVDYWRSPRQIHDGMQALVVELERRNRIAEHCALNRLPEPRFQRLVLLFDEANMTIDGQKDYWRTVREFGDPPTPPAVRSLKLLLHAGRQVRMHVILVTQHGAMNELGGPAIRVAFGGLVFMRSTPKAFRMLAEGHPIPPKDETPGRVWILVGSAFTEGQIPFLTNDEAEALALDPPPDTAARDGSRVETGEVIPTTSVPADATLGSPTPAVTAEARSAADGGQGEVVRERLVSLRQASSDGDALVGRSHDALKQAKSRGKRGIGRLFPTPAGRDGDTILYRLGDLIAFDTGHYNDPDQDPDREGVPSP